MTQVEVNWEVEWDEVFEIIKRQLPTEAIEAIQKHLAGRIPESMLYTCSAGGYRELLLDDVVTWRDIISIAVGKPVEQLTDAERKQAWLNAVLAAHEKT